MISRLTHAHLALTIAAFYLGYFLASAVLHLIRSRYLP